MDRKDTARCLLVGIGVEITEHERDETGFPMHGVGERLRCMGRDFQIFCCPLVEKREASCHGGNTTKTCVLVGIVSSGINRGMNAAALIKD